MSSMQKYRHRQRLRRVDRIVACVDNALAKQGMVAAAVERWKLEMPTEEEMEPKDKYTLFDRNAKKYRKGVHSTFFAYSHPLVILGGGGFLSHLPKACRSISKL